MKKTHPQAQQTLENVGDNLYRSVESGRYYAIFTRDDRQIKKSLKTTDKDLARRLLEDLRGKVCRLTSDSSKSLPFAEWRENKLQGGLAKRWIDFRSPKLKPRSLERRLLTIKSIGSFFRDKTVGAISKADIEYALNKRADEIGARSWNMELETLSGCFEYAVTHGIRLDNPVSHIERRKVATKHIEIPSRRQFQTLLKTIRAIPGNEQSANLVEFLAYSGCRISEVVGDDRGKPAIVWGDIDWGRKKVAVIGKGSDTGKVRRIELFVPLRRLLMTMKSALPTEPKPTDPIFTMLSAKKAIESACKRAGLPHYHHHTCRHFFCSNAIEAGADFKVIAEWLGHSDGGVLVAKTYGHLRAEHSTAMAKRLTWDAGRT